MGLLGGGINQANAVLVIGFNAQGGIAGVKMFRQQLTQQTKAAAMSANANVDMMAKRLHFFQRELTGFAVASGAAFALFATNGLKAADSLKVFEVKMKALTGTSEGAATMLARMKKFAVEMKQPLGDVLDAAPAVAQGLRMSGQDINRLEEALNIANRLAAKEPTQGISGAIFALNEAYAGQYRSLANRFNINPDQFRKALQETGDPLKALDKILNSIGLTTEAAIESSKTFSGAMKRLGDSLGFLAAEGFQPLLEEDIIPFIDSLTASLSKLREESPGLTDAIVRMAAALMLLLPAISVLTQVSVLLANIQALGGFAALAKSITHMSALGTATSSAFSSPFMVGGSDIRNIGNRPTPAINWGRHGAPSWGTQPKPTWQPTGVGANPVMGAMTALAGANLGEWIVRKIGENMKENEHFLGLEWAATGEQMKNADLMETAIGNLSTAWKLMPLVIADIVKIDSTFKLLLVHMAMGIGDIAKSIGDSLKASGIPVLTDLGKRMSEFGTWVHDGAKTFGRGVIAYQKNIDEWAESQVQGSFATEDATEKTQEFTKGLRQYSQLMEINEDQLKMYNDYLKEQEQLQENLKNELYDIEQEYVNNVLQLYLDRNKQVADAQLDFQRDNEQAERDLADRISDIQSDTNEQLVTRRKEYEQRVQEITTSFNDDQARALEEHQIKMQRMAEDHEENLENAAARLDAIAVVKEIMSYNKERRRAEEDFARSQAQREVEFTQRLEQERVALETEIQQLKLNNEEKILEAQKQFAREARERQIAFDQKLADIEAEYIAERQAFEQAEVDKRDAANAAYDQQLLDLRNHWGNMVQEAVNGESLVRQGFAAWWQDMLRISEATGFGTATVANVIPNSSGSPDDRGGYALGTDYVPETQRYLLHKGEAVLNPSQAANYRSGRMGNVISVPISIGAILDGKDFEQKVGPLIFKIISEALT